MRPTIQETEARRREMDAQNEINSLRATALPRGAGSRSAHGSPLGGPATPDEWACNRCMYSWDGNGGWCPSCGETATFATKKDKLMEKLRIIQSGETAILPSGEIVKRGTPGATDYDSANTTNQNENHRNQ
jgi:hypothetical protein